MPFPLPVVLDSNIKRLTLSRTWSKFAPGQIATSTGFFHSRKFSTGGFSALEIFFLFPLSIVLSEKLCLSDQYRRLNATRYYQLVLTSIKMFYSTAVPPPCLCFKVSGLAHHMNKAVERLQLNPIGFAHFEVQ
ncbi:hypothetical protein Sango_2250400 [Sesamum angolense]|uniref:Uncharacterized protein n=1 Tax=Sesamum angolense TaxID=2727404 RepID=A0AAE2BKY2_9LAMI|nr:hypothetical protein Sango_2250400 [Sesamum angolense]